MKLYKRLFICMLAIVMILVMLPYTPVAAKYEYAPDGLLKLGDFSVRTNVYNPDTEDYEPYTVEIARYWGPRKSHVSIPSTLGDYTVIGVSPGVFYEYENVIESISLPDTLTYVSYCAFRDLKKLRSVNIPSSVINLNGFDGCTSLTSIRIPDGVKTIGSDAFDGCTALESVSIGGDVEEIGDFAFAHCSSLTDITIPDKVEEISDSAFLGCSNLKSVTLPDGIKRICYRAFWECYSLTEITVPDKTEVIESSAFGYCTSLKTVRFPKRLKEIDTFFSISSNPALTDIYYEGSEDEWEEITRPNGFDYWIAYLGVTIHFNAGKTTVAKPVAVKENNDNIEFEQSRFTVPVPGDIPFIGGWDIDLNLKSVIIKASFVGDKYMVAIGYDYPFNKGDENGVLDNETAREEEKLWKQFKLKAKKGNFDFGIDPTYQPTLDPGFGVSLKGNVIGYAEAKVNREGEVVKCEGGLMLSISVSAGKEYPFYYVVPMVVKVKGTVGADLKLSVAYDFEKKNLSFDGEIKLIIPRLTLSVGPGIPYVTDVSLYSKLTNEVKIKFGKGVTATLKGEAGISFRYLGYTAKYVFVHENDGWEYYNSRDNKRETASVGASPPTEDSFVIDRSYLDKRTGKSEFGKQTDLAASGWEYERVYTDLLTDNVYDGASPKFISAGDLIVAVWLDDDGTRTDGNHTEMFYSYCYTDQNVWSAPQPIDDDGTADFYPDIATDGENIYAVWSDSDTVFEQTPALEDVAASCEINIAKFDTATHSFTDVRQLTDDDAFDAQPKVAVINSTPSVVWRSSSADSVLSGGTETIYRAVKGADAYDTTAIYASQVPIYEIVNGGDRLAFTADLDGDTATADDAEVYVWQDQGGIIRLTDNSSLENELAYSVISGETYLTYLCDGVLYAVSALGETNPVSDETRFLTGAYRFASEYDNTVLYTVEDKEIDGETDDAGGTEIYSYTINDDGEFANRSLISEYGEYVRDLSAVICNGWTYLFFLKTTSQITDDSVMETSQLCTAIVNYYADLKIDDVVCDVEKVDQNEPVTATVMVTNKGTVSADYFLLTIRDSDNSVIYSEEIEEEIKSGETKGFSVSIPNSQSILRCVGYIAEITDDYMWGTYDSMDFFFGYSQLQLTTLLGERDGLTGVIADVYNDSPFPSGAVLNVRSDDDELLGSYNIGEVKSGETVSYFIDNDKLYDYWQDTDILHLEIVARNSEEELEDNYEDFYLIDLLDFDFGDANKSGFIDILDATIIQRYLADLSEFDREQIKISDIDGSGDVNINDATIIQRYLAGYPTVLG